MLVHFAVVGVTWWAEVLSVGSCLTPPGTVREVGRNTGPRPVPCRGTCRAPGSLCKRMCMLVRNEARGWWGPEQLL